MTLRELFVTVARHLLKQGVQARKPGVGCQYRTPTGLRCAVGCLIPDEKYQASMEGGSVSWPLDMDDAPNRVRTILEAVGVEVDSEEHRLLSLLQGIHDYSGAGRERWEVELDKLASDYGFENWRE